MATVTDIIPSDIHAGPVTWLGGLLAAIGTLPPFGLNGLVAAGLLGLLWTRVSTVTVAAIGQLALLILFPDQAPIAYLLVIETGIIGMLAGTVYRVESPYRTMVVYAILVIVLAGVTWGTYLWTSRLSVGAGALTAVVAIGAYGLHRYEVVTLTSTEGPESPPLSPESGSPPS